MRPHRLDVTAFGPFPGTVVVDFDSLAASGLFLLHGETGAGKTTVLDALGFALYGRVPGERGRLRPRLRSDHADAATRTSVRLEVTIGGRRLRITRSPEQSRPRLRGSGTTTDPARMVLEEAGERGWEVRSTRVDEGSREVTELMGMSAEQFFQVVLLPQNDFARFLRASSEERGMVLQRLFGTDRFSRAESWLAEQRRASAAAVEEARADLRLLVARLAQAAGRPLPGVGTPGSGNGAAARSPARGTTAGSPDVSHAAATAYTDAGTYPDGGAGTATRVDPATHIDPVGTHADAGAGTHADDDARTSSADARAGAGADAFDLPVDPATMLLDPGWVQEEQRRTAAAAAAAADDLARQTAALRTAQAAAEEARALDNRQRRRASALRRREALAAAAPGIGRLRAELDAADRAATVAPLMGDVELRGTELGAARQAERTARGRLPTVGVDSDVREDDLGPVLEQARAHAGELAGLAPVAAALAHDEALVARSRQRAANVAQEEARAQAAVDALPGRRDEARRAVARAREAQVRLPVEQARAAVLRAAVTDAADLAAARGNVRRLTGRHLEAQGQVLDARQRALGLREARVDGMIAELAASLEPGTPCPVCGALEHPEPSAVRGARVSRDDEEAAFQAVDELARLAAAVQAELAAEHSRVEALVHRLAAVGGAGADPERLAAERAEQDRIVADVTAVAAGSAEAERVAAEVEGDAEEWLSTAGRLGEERRAAEQRAVDAERRADRARGMLAGRLGGAPDLAHALAACEDAVEVLGTAQTACAETHRARYEEHRAVRRAQEAALAADFDGLDAVRDALRPAMWRADAELQIRRHQAEEAATADQLADPDLDVALQPAADLAGTAQAVGRCQESQADAQRRHGLAAAAASAVADLAPRVRAAQEALQPLTRRADQTRALADAVNGSGNNGLRMTLTSFVLAARLEEVAAAASDRLLTMTSGRYALAHTDTGRGGARAGLGLVVRDFWTGQDRDTATLSGGETFLASLALALGLADVVTAEAGGAPIEALFVDEGFGTLDADTLEEVMGVLDGLRDGGRLVGLVSHVAELRQRIPAQVRLVKGRCGSDLAVVGC